MAGFVVRQVLIGVLVVFATVTLTFLLVRLSGDPTSLILAIDATEEQRNNLRHTLGLDRSLWEQYLTYVGNALTGDFGRSYFDNRAVSDIVLQHLPATLQLAGAAFALTVVTAVPLGVLSGIWAGGVVDRSVQVVSVIGGSMPSFWIGLLLIQLFALQLGLLPTYGRGSWAHLVLPALTLAIATFPSLARLTRSSMLEVLPQPYVETARAKGMPERRVVARTVLRNGATPVIVLLALEMGNLVGGAVLTETVFSWEGIGRLAIVSIERRDFPIVQGVVAYVALGFAIVTTLAEIVIRIINPRLRDQ